MLSLVVALLVAAADASEPKPPEAPSVPKAEAHAPSVPSPKEPTVAVPASSGLHLPKQAANSSDGGVSAPSATVNPLAVPGAATTEGPVRSPPSLTENALCEELRRGMKDRSTHSASVDAEKKNLAKERARLEQLSADVEKARASLKEETVRLEALLKKQAAQGENGHERARADFIKPGTPLEKSSVEGIAKALHSMKPEQGAQLLTKLDRPLASEVLRKMKPADVGAVMEKLKPEVAAELVSMMAVATVTKEQRQ